MTERRRGNRLGFKFFESSLRLFGLKGTYGFLYFACAYYLLFDKAARVSALCYVTRRFPNAGFLMRHLHVYRLFISQGEQLIDRYAAISNFHQFDMELKGGDAFFRMLQAEKQGLILLTTHVGNWQLALSALKKANRKVHLLMRSEENPAVRDFLKIGNETGDISIISPDQYLGGTVEIMNALSKGHIVSIMGDRHYGAKTIACEFLGETAFFPFSAFAFAASAKCPIVLLSAVKETDNRYVVDVSSVFRPEYANRRDKEAQLTPWVRQFVALQEKILASYPYQCFLFHDIWR